MTIMMPASDQAVLARRAEIIAALRAIVPGEGVIDSAAEMRASSVVLSSMKRALNFASSSVLLFIREQYAVGVRFLSLFGQSAICFTWKRLFRRTESFIG